MDISLTEARIIAGALQCCSSEGMKAHREVSYNTEAEFFEKICKKHQSIAQEFRYLREEYKKYKTT